MGTTKEVLTGSAAREEMLKGVNILADAVKATLGPRGRHAAIEREYGPPLITKDGVTVARNINLKNRQQNMGAQLIKSVAAAANNLAGDGTTTATVLAQAIYSEGLKAVANGNNPVLIKRGIDIASNKIVERLKQNSTNISDVESLAFVATISANNDKELGELISSTVAAVGKDGVITVENGTGGITKVDFVEGLKLDRGLLSREFISNAAKLTCEMENCFILMYDDKVNSIHEVAELLTAVANTGKSLLMIVKDITEEALAHIVLNRVQNKLNFCVIKAPGFGDTRRDLLRDVATVCGGTALNNDHGQKFKHATMDDLGFAKKIVVGLNETTIIEGQGKKEVIEQRINEIKTQLQESNIYSHQIESLRSRLSRLTGGIALFKVGGTTEAEVKERKDRVEDAINAVRSALEEGVVSGGGSALLHCLSALDEIPKSSLLMEEVIGISIVAQAVKAPFKQILFNAGITDDFYVLMNKVIEGGKDCGFDALRMEMVDNMLGQGIIDPVKVVRSALEHAASASGTLLTTEVIIFNDDSDL